MIKCDYCNLEKEDKFFYFDSNNANNRKTTCIKCYNKQRPKEPLNDPRRNTEGSKVSMILYKRKEKGIKKIYKGSLKPYFLQLVQLMYNHVENIHNISRNDLSLMLLLYPVVPFDKKDFLACRKLSDHKNSSFFNFLLEENWIFEWQDGFYTFTKKGFELMSDCHLWASGEKYISEAITEDVMDIIRRIQRKNK